MGAAVAERYQIDLLYELLILKRVILTNFITKESVSKKTRRGSSDSNDAAWDASHTEIDPRVRHILL